MVVREHVSILTFCHLTQGPVLLNTASPNMYFQIGLWKSSRHHNPDVKCQELYSHSFYIWKLYFLCFSWLGKVYNTRAGSLKILFWHMNITFSKWLYFLSVMKYQPSIPLHVSFRNSPRLQCQWFSTSRSASCSVWPSTWNTRISSTRLTPPQTLLTGWRYCAL